METKIATHLRKWCGVIAAIMVYYFIHEGSHLVVALKYGGVEKIKIMGVGIQMVTRIEEINSMQRAIFCVVGSVSTLLVAYLLVGLTRKIVHYKNKFLKAICYYVTMGMLLIDPIYLACIYKFVGGGDMNGIKLFGISEAVLQMIYGAIGIVNILLIIKYIYPVYKKAFNHTHSIE